MYSIDTSSIIEARQEIYPPASFPSLWERFGDLVDGGGVVATDVVKWELKKKADGEWKWASSLPGEFFVPLDDDVQVIVREILQKHPRLAEEGKKRTRADPFVMALAKHRGLKVVTAERFSSKARKPKIPNVCRTMGIPCLTFPQLVAEQGWVF